MVSGARPPPVPPSPESVDANSKASAESASDWEEYADATGQPYWYNRVTLVSTWDKPDELKSEFEKEETSDWKEYTDEEGRKYYHDTRTSETTWVMPDIYRAFLERLEERKRLALETPMEKLLKSVFPEEQTKQQFARLLVERRMQSTWTQDQCVSATFEDERSKALKMAERKQVYQVMVQKLKTFEEDERRKKERQLHAHFNVMLDSWTEADRYSTYREMCDKFSDNAAFTNITSEKERIHLFNDFKKDKERKEAEKLKLDTELKLAAFKQYLQSCVGTQQLTASTTWNEFVASHSSVPAFAELEPVERIQAYLAHVRELATAEDEQIAIERRAQRIAARKARESYRSLLMEKFALHAHSTSSSLPPSMQFDSSLAWHNFLPLVSQDPRYLAMFHGTGSTPAELFYDYVTELHQKYMKEKRKVKNLARSLGVRVLRFNSPKNGSQDPSPGTHNQPLAMPENLLKLSFEEAPKLDFKMWMQPLRSHLHTTDEHTLRRIYCDFGTRELVKIQNRVTRAQQNLLDAVKSTLRKEPSSTERDVRYVLDSSPEFSILSEKEKENMLHQAFELIRDPQQEDKVRREQHPNEDLREGPTALFDNDAKSTGVFGHTEEYTVGGRRGKRSRPHHDDDGYSSSSDSDSQLSSYITSPPTKLVKKTENSRE